MQGLKTKCTWAYTHATPTLLQPVSHPTPSLLQPCLCASYVVPKAQRVCAEPALKPGPSPPSMLLAGKGKELQRSAASDVLQSLFLWLLAGDETCTKHPLPSSLARD